jgi:DNA (cytosine-5)-methyltransferase 1
MNDLAYYNEFEKYSAEWLRNLINKGHIAKGYVDQRDIREVKAIGVQNYKQAHFFAGIGTWSYALRLAGWTDDREVWTGSCPCQPFSTAGRHGGTDDPRHLWPNWFNLIRECRPAVIIGEQVASPLGLAWLDIVQTDLENEGYTFAAVDLCAAGVGAPHIRQRTYFVAHTKSFGERRLPIQPRKPFESQPDIERGSEIIGLANTNSGFSERKEEEICTRGNVAEHSRGLGDTQINRSGAQYRQPKESKGEQEQAGGSDLPDRLANTEVQRLQERDRGKVLDHGTFEGLERLRSVDFWKDAEWLPCRDGYFRPTKPGIFPLANGSPQRMGRLRAYGNAIVAPLAAEFIKAYMEVIKI